MADINESYKKFIDLLWANVLKAYKSCFRIKYDILTASEFRRYVNIAFPNVTCILHDQYYHITDWETWKRIIEFDWTNKKKYTADTFDCDNFSATFCARVAEIFNLNTVGRFSCSVTTSLGKVIPHRACAIVAKDGDKTKVFVFESQNDGWQEVKAGQPIKIKDWTYTPIFTEFN